MACLPCSHFFRSPDQNDAPMDHATYGSRPGLVPPRSHRGRAACPFTHPKVSVGGWVAQLRSWTPLHTKKGVPATPRPSPRMLVRLPSLSVHVEVPLGDPRPRARHGTLPRLYLGPDARVERRTHAVERGTEAEVRPPGCSCITRPSLCLFTTCSTLFYFGYVHSKIHETHIHTHSGSRGQKSLDLYGSTQRQGPLRMHPRVSFCSPCSARVVSSRPLSVITSSAFYKGYIVKQVNTDAAYTTNKTQSKRLQRGCFDFTRPGAVGVHFRLCDTQGCWTQISKKWPCRRPWGTRRALHSLI